ncbi:MAG: efflux RND transporter periplasmic adaptor subunit [bacterium]
MKTILRFTGNLLGFLIITLGLVYAYFAIQPEGAEPRPGTAPVQAAIPPQERDPNRLWCQEHGIYEDECVLCHPERAAQGMKEPAASGDIPADAHEHAHEDAPGHDHGHIQTSEGTYCAEHNLPGEECGICQPQQAEILKPGESLKIRLGSLESASKAEIQTTKPQTGVLSDERTFLCETAFNQNRFARISPLADGVIQNVRVDVGEEVKEGQVLVEIASPEIAKAWSEYLKAIDQEKLKEHAHQREKDLAAKNISAKQDLQQAEAEYQIARTETQTARQQLINLGLTADDVTKMGNARSSSSRITLRAPFVGTIVERNAVMGEAVKAGEPLFQLADLSTLWLELSIPEDQAASARKGSRIVAEFDALPGLEGEGKIDWISPQVDRDTRMIKARAVIPNEEGKLKAGLFGQVQLVQETRAERIIVPHGAVQRVDGKPFVFVRQGDDLFDLRHVRLGRQSGGRVEILAGVSPADEVVTAGSFTLKSEFLKSRFGAGCAHD